VARRWSRIGALSLTAAALFGATLGLGLFTFSYGEGVSYFSTDPEACVNCHIMQPYFDSWVKSSHHASARCVDCHLPHETVPKYIAKADNGFFHSVGFTFQNFPEPIRIKPRNRRIVQQNCNSCHADMVHELLPAVQSGEAVTCVHCHRDVGHAAWR
jgi:cytochrome c nitrite reductase small subunit